MGAHDRYRATTVREKKYDAYRHNSRASSRSIGWVGGALTSSSHSPKAPHKNSQLQGQKEKHHIQGATSSRLVDLPPFKDTTVAPKIRPKKPKTTSAKSSVSPPQVADVAPRPPAQSQSYNKVLSGPKATKKQERFSHALTHSQPQKQQTRQRNTDTVIVSGPQPKKSSPLKQGHEAPRRLNLRKERQSSSSRTPDLGVLHEVSQELHDRDAASAGSKSPVQFLASRLNNGWRQTRVLMKPRRSRYSPVAEDEFNTHLGAYSIYRTATFTCPKAVPFSLSEPHKTSQPADRAPAGTRHIFFSVT